MTITKESYVDLQEKYEKVKKLIEEDSKADPETEPFLSKYSARQLLIGMKANIENLLRTQAPDSKEFIKLTGMLGTVLLYLGTISIDTEESAIGEKHLTKCKEVIEAHELKPEIVLLMLNMHNQFGILWSQREPETSKVHLEKAESLYKTFKDIGLDPIDITDLFKANIETYNVELGKKNFEKVYTLTLYYLAQIYGALKNTLKSSVYCHTTLKRQLDSDDYELIEWALNSATLSQFFMEKNGFKQARHHLAASSYMLEIYENQLNQIPDRGEEYQAKLETFRHRSADIARCWAKYGLLLLSSSRDRLLKHTDDIDSHCTLTSDLANLQLNSDSTVSKDDLAHLEFPTLNVAVHENEVTYEFILTLQDARKVFLNIQSWLSKAHSYYTLNNLASDYMQIAQDQSQMYNYLAFFEDNPENQAKMHKRRADLLENVVKEVNPTYYLQYCREIWFELGQIYSEILDIKMEKLRESETRPMPHALSKINTLVEKSIQNYMNFINSFKDVSTNILPKTINGDFQKPFLQAYLHIAALHSRFISLDKHITLVHVQESLESYKKINDYCSDNPNVEQLIPAEMSICREMIRLLPIKIAKLLQEIEQ